MFRSIVPQQLDEEALIVSTIKSKARPLRDNSDLEPLMDRIGNARVVMLGEASHGTHEYYTWRARLTKRLILEKGFRFIAVEGDWPDCYRLNRYIKGYSKETKARDVLHEFRRWPTWMWANWEIVALAEWLQKHNQLLPVNKRVGFYGLDVYSLWESLEAVLGYLEKTDRQAWKLAKQAMQCFEPYMGDEGRDYAFALRLVPELCETEVINMLTRIQQQMPMYDHDYENAFSTEQNAYTAVNAERYYRAMIQGGGASWNVRDQHMQETLERLIDFHGSDAKAIVWAHNTHVGDARFTDMAESGMYNIGELARKKYGKDNVVLVGCGSYQGTVIAGDDWGEPMQVMDVPKGKKGSWEYLLHECDGNDMLLLVEDFKKLSGLEKHIGHRAIGVVYNPRYEYGNYVPSILPDRYDAFIYIDQTKALHPLHIRPQGGKIPETYPFGL